MNWHRVARYLEDAAAKKQDEANAHGASNHPAIARQKDETASLLRTLAEAIRFGLSNAAADR